MSNENENWLFFVLCADRGSATTRKQRQRRRRQRQRQIQRRRSSSSSSSLPLFRSIERSSSKITKMYLFFFYLFLFLPLCLYVCVCVCARIQTNSFGHLERTLYGLLFLSCPMTLSLWLSCTCVWGSDRSAVRCVFVVVDGKSNAADFHMQEECRMLPLIEYVYKCMYTLVYVFVCVCA